MRILISLTALAIGTLASSSSAIREADEPEVLDGEFGVDGIVTTSIDPIAQPGPTQSSARVVALQPDGRILLASQVRPIPFGPNEFGLSRFESDGLPDLQFGNGGRTSFAFGEGSSSLVKAMSVQLDGKIILAGHSTVDHTNGVVARYNLDGTLDVGFGNGGLSRDSVTVSDLAIQSNGKIVMAGLMSGNRFSLARLLENGTSDENFGNIGGRMLVDFGNASFWIRKIAIQADDKIVVAGTVTGAFPVGVDFALARFSPDGLIDKSFGTEGLATLHLGSRSETVNAVAIRPDGCIVIAGRTESVIGLACFRPDGTPDLSFGDAGIVRSDEGYSAYAISARADNKILVTGEGIPGIVTLCLDAAGLPDPGFGVDGAVKVFLNHPYRLYRTGVSVVAQSDGRTVLAAAGGAMLLRLAPDGSLDSGFSEDGIVIGGFGASEDSAKRVALLSSGGILVVGTTNDGENQDLFVAKYHQSGELDSSFGTAGRVVVDISGKNDSAAGIAVQPDGKIVIAGTGGIESACIAVVRLLGDGTLDPEFSADGIAYANSSLEPELATGLALQDDGRILVCGNLETSERFLVARFLPNGAADPSFSSDGKAVFDAGIFRIPAGECHAIGLQPSGEILLAGSVGEFDGGVREFTILRLTEEGVLDVSFGGDGRVLVDFPESDHEVASAIIVQPDHRILVAGALSVEGDDDTIGVTRLEADGRIDLTFGDRGRTVSRLGERDRDHQFLGPDVQDMVLFPDGRFAIVGSMISGIDGRHGFAVSKFFADGCPDAGFAGDGRFRLRFGEYHAGGNGLALLPDGDLVVVGEAWNSGSRSIVVLRLDGNEPDRISVWRQLHFGSCWENAVSGSDSDPDGDRLSNFGEWAVGQDPNAFDSSPLTLEQETAGSGADLVRFWRSAEAVLEGVSFELQWNSDLSPTGWSETGVSYSLIADDGMRSQIQARVARPVGATNRRRYFRLVLRE